MSKYKLVIFDLDNCLIHEGVNGPILFDDTINILKFLKSKNIKISLASYNFNGINLLKKLDIYKFFDPELCYAYNDFNKNKHLLSIIAKSKLINSEIIFCDDTQHNIIHGRILGLKSVLVNPMTGIAMKDFETLI